MNAPLPIMSRTPTTAMAGTRRPAGRQADRVTTTAAPIRIASAPRMTTSGPKACPSLICAAHTLNAPIATPPTSASSMPDRPPPSSRTRDTSTTATTAAAIPTSTSGGGRPSRTIPAVTGISAAMTPVTGATTPIRPTASPR